MRIVDHMAENYCNATVFAKRKLQNDGLDDLEYIIFKMLELGLQPRLSKGDVSKAYRLLLAKVDNILFNAVVYSYKGELYVSTHLAMPFGAVGSVWAFHRIANLVLAFVRQPCKCPLLKYVDDFFAATRRGISVSGICLANMAMTCLGIPFDPRKTFLFQEQMVILGAKLSMMWAKRGYHLCIEDDKRRRGRKKLSECFDEKKMEAGVASKSAGQLNW